MPIETPREFEDLLEYLKTTRGFDFTSYKRASLMRRIDKRMQMVGSDSYEQYMDYLEVHPDEFSYLFNMILINVTAFLRDPGAWEYISSDVIPAILANKSPDSPIRAWVAGCASGEEAYTLAMLLAEALGIDQFTHRVKIYATDLDEEALSHARQASYSARRITGIPPDMLAKYFEQVGHRYVFNKDLRRSVIFGRHDLIQDAPISRIDLITCRNTLMYFNTEAQARIMGRFHFALSTTGYLFLGKAEMLFAHTNLFTPIDIKRRVFTKNIRGNARGRLSIITQTIGEELISPIASSAVLNHVRMRDAAFDADPLAQVIIDCDGVVTFVNDRARGLFGITIRDLGRPLQDLEISYRPAELRSCIEQAYREQRAITLKDVEWRPGSEDARHFDVQILPLLENVNEIIGIKIVFADVTRFRELQEELRHSKQELETAYEELQSSNEELVTTNEELQSTIEELETTNEELQSTNEELETMNEELQSSNEELETMNEELRQQGEEFTQVDNFLQAVLTSLPAGALVVDRRLYIHVWNQHCEDMWGLRTDEVTGTHLMSIDCGLPVDQLKPAVRLCLSGDQKVVDLAVHTTNRRGKHILCKLKCTPLANTGEEIRGAMILMEESEAPQV